MALSQSYLVDYLRTASQSAPIFTLPPELLHVIGRHCQLPDLANMRLTCKGLCNVLTSEFARKFPTDRRFIITPQSLWGLIQMKAHPIIGPRFV